MTCSALNGLGLEAIWEMISQYADLARAQGAFEQARADQNLTWMHQLIDELLRASVSGHPSVQAAMADVEAEVRQAKTTPLAAAQSILALSRQPV